MVKKKIETCEVEKPCKCRIATLLIPIAVIALVWFWPAVKWSKITVTVLMALAILAHGCPCRRK